jgi:ubiquinone/menaquinone biosynthesis C-methylase UbiE
LPPDSLDVVLMYDVSHDLRNFRDMLAELRRVLRLEGLLSVSDHHLKQDEIVCRMTEGRLFKLSRKGSVTCNFIKK